MPLTLKGPSCKGCPFASRGQYMVLDELRHDAPVFIVGQNPGKQEEAQGVPFVGKTGSTLENVYLPYAGLDRSRVSLGNCIRCRVDGTDQLPHLNLAQTKEAIAHCNRAYLRVPPATKLVIAQGAYSWFMLTGLSDITEWRGAVVPMTLAGVNGLHQHPSKYYRPIVDGALPVLATGHLASMYHGKGKAGFLSNVIAFKSDWRKVGRILRGEWPEPLNIVEAPPTQWPTLSAFDTEFNPFTKEFYRYSVAWRDADGQTHIHVVDGDALALQTPPPTAASTVVLHNAPADLRSLRRILHTQRTQIPLAVEDSMYLHSVLWPDLPHDLGFLISLYAHTNQTKHLSETSPIEYAAGDAIGTYDAWMAMRKEAERDPQSWQVYVEEQLPLLSVIAPVVERGLRVLTHRVSEAGRDLCEQSHRSQLHAQVAVGWPINVGSQLRVAQELYDVARLR